MSSSKVLLLIARVIKYLGCGAGVLFAISYWENNSSWPDSLVFGAFVAFIALVGFSIGWVLEGFVKPEQQKRTVLGWVVVAVAVFIGFLPSYSDYTPRDKISEVLLGMSSNRTQIEQFYSKHKRLPRDAAEAGLDLRGGGKIRSLSYDGSTGELRAVIQNVPEANGKVLRLRAHEIKGELNWRCSGNDISKEHLPRPCRNW